MKNADSIEKIKTELINSCVNYDAKLFLPFLMSNYVLTGMPTKKRFYSFFKFMVCDTKKCSDGQLTFKIENEKITSSGRNYDLNFYDEVHMYSRLSIVIKETDENIYLDVLPF